MLVTFSCPAFADITMFGEVVVQLLKLMGHSGTVPSALLAEDVAPALERLQTAIAALQPPPEPEPAKDTDNDEPVVSLSHRAVPLLGLLEAAAKANCHVMWESNQ